MAILGLKELNNVIPVQWLHSAVEMTVHIRRVLCAGIVTNVIIIITIIIIIIIIRQTYNARNDVITIKYNKTEAQKVHWLVSSVEC